MYTTSQASTTMIEQAAVNPPSGGLKTFPSITYEASVASNIDEECSVTALGMYTAHRQTHSLFSKENRKINKLCYFYLVLLVAYGAVLSALTYVGVVQSLDSQLVELEHERGEYFLVALQDQLLQSYSRMQGLADELIQLTHSNETWPGVTVPNFTEHTQTVDASYILFAPMVTNETRPEWISHVEQHATWIEATRDASIVETRQEDATVVFDVHYFNPDIYDKDGTSTGSGPFLPLWQTSPTLLQDSYYNYDLLESSLFKSGILKVLEQRDAAFTPLLQLTDKTDPIVSSFDDLDSVSSALFVPVRDIRSSTVTNSTVAATVIGLFSWKSWFAKALAYTTYNEKGAFPTIVVEDMCSDRLISLTAQISGKIDSAYITDNEMTRFDSAYSSMLVVASENFGTRGDSCSCILHYFPNNVSLTLRERTQAILLCLFTALAFATALCVFVMYARLVETRQKKVLQQAIQSTAVVSSLFPGTVADRLIRCASVDNFVDGCLSLPYNVNDDVSIPENNDKHMKECMGEDMTESALSQKAPPKVRLRSYLKEARGVDSDVIIDEGKPIADFFPHCTVMFADIVGFTAWSSQREPTQVFILLQNVYQVFDRAARRGGVFKVETIGDSYVCVTGLPEAQEDHAIRMAEFALECRVKLREVTRKLQRSLGPDTDDLRMRFGLHSGPVTAGVLKGERARFQLFGDTVNTAARMESTGERNRIQLSNTTAELLMKAGKTDWVKKRDEAVAVKGKGDMQTFWLKPAGLHSNLYSSQRWNTSNDNIVVSSTSLHVSRSLDYAQKQGPKKEAALPDRRKLTKRHSMVWGQSQEVLDNLDAMPVLKRNSSSKTGRLVEWNVELLSGLLKQVVAQRRMVHRNSMGNTGMTLYEDVTETTSNTGAGMITKTALDEVVEVITLPNFEPATVGGPPIDPDTVILDAKVVHQIRDYVEAISSMYRDNPFHNFEHACHVQMSMNKLLQRVTTPENISYEDLTSTEALAHEAHAYTYGITSDPLTQFAVIFCALIHDVDHTGVPNGQLIKEQAHIATLYKNKSVAEQNSVDLAWDLLMDSRYRDLRRCLYTTEAEYSRFRQLVVNVVLATDIFDKELSALRKNRWSKAFHDEQLSDEPSSVYANRRATIVIEHLIQASDVSHTMQHWDIYCKWNARLFQEMYQAFKSGRTDKDPSDGWYKGELWFFDNYVIPLAKKLQECEVFGVCSDECLNYAMENRSMWEVKGEQIVAQMIETQSQQVATATKLPKSRPRTRQSVRNLIIEED